MPSTSSTCREKAGRERRRCLGHVELFNRRTLSALLVAVALSGPFPGRAGGRRGEIAERTGPPAHSGYDSALDRIGPYNEKRALLLSILGTGITVCIGTGIMTGGLVGDVEGPTWAGAGVIALGFAVPPSFGHLYARNYRRSYIMMGIRLALVAAGMVPLVIYRFSEGEVYAIREHMYRIFVVPLVSIGTLVVALNDLFTIRRSVRRANSAYRERLGIVGGAEPVLDGAQHCQHRIRIVDRDALPRLRPRPPGRISPWSTAGISVILGLILEKEW